MFSRSRRTPETVSRRPRWSPASCEQEEVAIRAAGPERHEQYPRATADTDGLAAGEAQIEAVRGGRRGCSSGRLSRYCGGASSLPTVA